MNFNRTQQLGEKMTKTLAVIACLTSSLVLAQTVPGSITFNARLTDTGGAPVTGSHALGFGLYDTGSGGAAVWTENVSGASFSTDGLAYVELGAVTPLSATVFVGRKLYLEVSVDGTTMSPRLSVVSVPYALRASVAASALSIGSLTEPNIQRRITGTCPAGQAVRSVDASGGVQCENIVGGGGSGDVTSVTTASTSGLTGGATSGDIALALATCANGQVLLSDGMGWNCAAPPAGATGATGAPGAPGAAGAAGAQGPAGPAGGAMAASFDFEEVTTSLTSADSSGSGNTLTLNNVGSVITASGHSRNGILLDGISGFAANTAPNINVREEITVSAWVFRTAVGGTSQTVAAREGQFTLGIINNNVQLAIQTANGPGWAYFGSGVVPLNAWTHVMGSYDGVGIRIFVNGMLTSYTAYASGILATVGAAVPLRIGNRQANNEYFTGRLDEVRVSPIAQGRGQFPRYFRVQGYISDNTDNAAVPGRSFTAVKRTDSTGLRVTWSDNFRVLNNDRACRWEVLFGGVSCTNPGGLYFDKYEGNTNSNRHDPSSFVGTCFATAAGAIPAGNVSITGRVGPTPGYTTGVVPDCATGWNSQLFNMDAEEVQQ